MRKALATCAAMIVLAVAQAGGARAMAPDEDTVEAPGPRCVQRTAVPALDNAIEAKWSPDGWRLAVVRFERRPSARNASGYQEDEDLQILDLRTGKLRDLGEGDRPQWSGSGKYLSYWGPRADFLLVLDDKEEVVAKLTPSMPEYRWSGDTLTYIERTTIRAWSGGTPSTLVKLADKSVPHYPTDDLYWSGDASRFTLTRYELREPEPERWIGTTETGDLAPLDVPGATYTEWAPAGATLLVRYPGKLEIRDRAGQALASIPIARGALHSWGPDGSTLYLRASRASAAAGDKFDDVQAVWPADAPAETLPNVLGPRALAPDSKRFAGVVRTGRHDGVLRVFRCTEVTRGAVTTPDPEAGARLASIDAAGGRLIRPAAGDVAQFLQGAHTGVDVAAPIGSPIVAADDGVVTKTGFKEDGGGRYVCLQHVGGLETCYYHASSFLVAVGDRVARGQPIALVGMSGLTTGPHVHWEAKLDGKVIDPLQR